MSGREEHDYMRRRRTRSPRVWGRPKLVAFLKPCEADRQSQSGSASERSRPETAASDFEFVLARWRSGSRCGARRDSVARCAARRGKLSTSFVVWRLAFAGRHGVRRWLRRWTPRRLCADAVFCGARRNGLHGRLRLRWLVGAAGAVVGLRRWLCIRRLSCSWPCEFAGGGALSSENS